MDGFGMSSFRPCLVKRLGKFRHYLNLRVADQFPQADQSHNRHRGCIDIDGVEFPILQIEIGKQGFSIAHPLKDLPKTFSTMSKTLHGLVLAMAKLGGVPKMPEFMAFGLVEHGFGFVWPIPSLTAKWKSTSI